MQKQIEKFISAFKTACLKQMNCTKCPMNDYVCKKNRNNNNFKIFALPHRWKVEWAPKIAQFIKDNPKSVE